MTKTDFSCLVCGGGDCAVYLRGCRDLWCGAPGAVDYMRCAECGLVQQHPVPDDVSVFYEGYPMHSEVSELYERIRRAVNADVYYRPAAPASCGVDFGCGDGNFLSLMNSAGARCCGFEPSAALAEQVAKKTGAAVHSDMRALAGEARACGGFDFAAMHKSFEHLNNPAETLRELAALLRPGGEIYAVTPVLSSPEAKVFGKKWSGLDAPRHIFFPEKAHYLRLAENCGLRLRRCRRVRFSPLLAGSLSIVLTGRMRDGVFKLLMPASWALSFLLPGSLLAASLEKPRE